MRGTLGTSMTEAQSHMDRLTSLDASFLTNETGPSHMHIGAVVIFVNAAIVWTLQGRHQGAVDEVAERVAAPR